MKHYLRATDANPQKIRQVLKLAHNLKQGNERPGAVLQGRTIALLFEKPSLRTRVSFEVAIHQLGGKSIFMGPDEVGIGKRESISDVVRVLSRYVDALVVRTFSQDVLDEMAQHSAIPVINALSDDEHPCQALADLMTLQENCKDSGGIVVAYLGDGNNVCRSLVLAGSSLGMSFRVASPIGYELPAGVVQEARRLSKASGASIDLSERPVAEVVSGVDAIYTDVWVSMGQDLERNEREEALRHYQVTKELLDRAGPGVVFLHPLPAKYGQEVAPGILEDPRSVVFDQAENRLHVQKALLIDLLARRVSPV